MEIGLIQMISSDLQQSFNTHSALGALATISDPNGGRSQTLMVALQEKEVPGKRRITRATGSVKSLECQPVWQVGVSEKQNLKYPTVALPKEIPF